MWTTCLERIETNEVINISDYGFEWYKNGRLIKEGLVENKEDDIQALIEEGFEIVK